MQDLRQISHGKGQPFAALQHCPWCKDNTKTLQQKREGTISKAKMWENVMVMGRNEKKVCFFLKKSSLNHIIRHIVSLSWLFPFFLLTVSKLAIASITCVIYVLEKGVCTLPDRKLQKKVSLHTPLGNYNHSKNCSTWHNSKQHITFSLSNLPN